MIFKAYLTLPIFLISLSTFSQNSERKNLKGKVSANTDQLDGIYVLNLSSKKETATKEGGYFSIPAKEGDSIMFSAVQLKGDILVIKESDFNSDLFFVRLEAIVNQLDEVLVVRYKSLNAYDLGIIPKPAKVYTPAERRLKTATGLDPKIGLNSSLTIDPLFNLLSGRTAMLKKELENEKKQHWIEQLEDLFGEDYYIEKLKIPLDYVRGFQYFAVENEKFVKTLGFKDKATAIFLLGELAKKYNEIIGDEK